MLNVALTFDYELFFGENFDTADAILFDPTKKLLDVLDRYNVKATFFADVLSVYMHEKYGLTDYCEKFKAQLQDMISRGHDVQLHIHSNWLKSMFADGKWNFDIDSYRIHTFGFDNNEETSVPNIIKWGKEYLESVAREVDGNYCCVAYRAGGYSVQPHEQLFKCLLKNQIYIDSSVAIGQKADGVNKYDFTEFPERCGWWVKTDGKLNEPSEQAENAMYEIPIYFYRNSLLRRLFAPKSEQRLKLGKMRGSFVGTNTQNISTKRKRKLEILFSYGKIKSLLSVDSLPYQAVLRAIDICAKKNSSKNGSISIIGHPKLVDNVWLENFDNFLNEAKKHKHLSLIPICEMAYLLRNKNV